jgi:hypothetical protein
MRNIEMYVGRERKPSLVCEISNRWYARLLRVAKLSGETPSQWLSRVMRQDAEAGFPVLNRIEGGSK